MGSFIGHVIPGTMFLLVGLWHMICSIHGYATRPEDFRSKSWHPCRLPGPLKYLELQVIMLGTFLDMLPVELLMATHFRPFINGAIAPGHLNNFEHATMLLMFFIYATVSLLSEATSLLPLPPGGLHLVAAAAFLGEFLLFFFHSTSHHGLEGRYHIVLALEIMACVVMAVLCAAHPRSFLIDVAASAATMLQGLWFWQTAFSMYGRLLPLGCHLLADGVECDSDAATQRGMSIATLQFVLHIAGVMVFTLLSYAVITRAWGHGNIPLLAAKTYQALDSDASPRMSGGGGGGGGIIGGGGGGGGGGEVEMKHYVIDDEDEVPLSLHLPVPNGGIKVAGPPSFA